MSLINRLKEVLTGNSAYISELETELETVKTERDNLQETVNAMRTERDQLKETIKQHEAQAFEIESLVKTAETGAVGRDKKTGKFVSLREMGKREDSDNGNKR